jgi:hypothetical protein
METGIADQTLVEERYKRELELWTFKLVAQLPLLLSILNGSLKLVCNGFASLGLITVGYSLHEHPDML